MSLLTTTQIQALAPDAAYAVFQGVCPPIPSQPQRPASANLTDLQTALTDIDAACDLTSGTATALNALLGAIPAPCSSLPSAQQTILVVMVLLKRAGLI